MCRVRLRQGRTIAESLGIPEARAKEIADEIIRLALHHGVSHVENLALLTEKYGDDCPSLILAVFFYGQAYHAIAEILRMHGYVVPVFHKYRLGGN